MLTQAKAMFLYEVDNTLLDNARFATDLTARLDDDFGIGGPDLGKALATRTAAGIGSSNELELRHDASTNTLIRRYHRLRSPGA